jgi:hypothetical protein
MTAITPTRPNTPSRRLARATNWSRPATACPGADAVVVLAVLVGAVAVVVARRPGAVTHPALWAEDGRFWLADAYNRGPWAPLVHAHTGYLQTYSRLVADVGLLLPLRQVPALFAAAAIAVQVLPAVVLVSRRFDALVPSRWARLAAACAYLAVPNSFEVDANLTNAQWHLALLALLCLLATPANRWWRAFDVGAVVLSGLSGPFPLALAAVGALWVWRGTRARWHRVLWAVTAALAALQGATLLVSPRSAGSAPLGISAVRLVEVVGGQVGLGGTIGAHGLRALAGGGAVAADAVGLAVLLIVWGAVLAWGPAALRVATLYAAVVLAGSLATPVTTPGMPRWQVLVGADGVRYWFVPLVVYLWDALWLAGTAVAALARRRSTRSATAVTGGPMRDARPVSAPHRAAAQGAAAFAGVAVVATAAVVGMPGDWSYPDMPTVHDGPAIAALHQAPPGTPVTFPIDPPGWTMVLVKH